MNTTPKPVQETVIVRAGVLGSSEEGIGQAYVDTGELSGDVHEDMRTVGTAMARGYQAALEDAVADLQPKLPAIFARGQQR